MNGCTGKILFWSVFLYFEQMSFVSYLWLETDILTVFPCRTDDLSVTGTILIYWWFPSFSFPPLFVPCQCWRWEQQTHIVPGTECWCPGSLTRTVSPSLVTSCQSSHSSPCHQSGQVWSHCRDTATPTSLHSPLSHIHWDNFWKINKVRMTLVKVLTTNRIQENPEDWNLLFSRTLKRVKILHQRKVAKRILRCSS